MQQAQAMQLAQAMPQAQAIPVQSTVVVQPLPGPYYVQSKAINRQVLGLGITELILGVLCVAFNIASLAMYSYAAFISAGIWCGIVYIVTGAFGIAAGKRKTKSWYNAFMVMSIISASLTVAIVIQASIGIAHDKNGYYYWSWVCECYLYDKRDAKLSMHSLLLICGVFEAIFLIWGSVLCCKVACCKTVQLTPMPQQSVSYVGRTQQVAVANQHAVMISQTQVPVMYRTIPGMQQQFVVTPIQGEQPPVYGQVVQAPQAIASTNDNQQHLKNGQEKLPI